MSDIKIANRYASALYQQAVADDSLSVINDDMKLVFNTCKNSKDLMLVLQNPIIKSSEKKAVLKQVFTNVNPLLIKFIDLICEKNREDLLSRIAESFLVINRQHLGIEKVDVISAIELDLPTIESIKKYILAQTGAKEIELNSSINPELIGGMQIKFGDNMLDTSISAKLKKLKKELNIA